MIEIKGLKKSFGNLLVFKDINLKIEKGECVALIGPSGAGKSVLFRTIVLLEEPDEGSVIINGTDITQKNININKVREKLGMVYQGFHLFSHLNVLDNITLALRSVKKQKRPDAEKKAFELLSLVGLKEKAKYYPRQLSGGQQQRIAIARTMAMEPDIILFDEPTSALDPIMTCEVLSIIKKLATMGFTMVISTHEMEFAKEVAHRVLYMDDAGIYEEGTSKEIFENPKREKTKAFINQLKAFRYTVISVDFDRITMNAEIEVFCRKYRITATRIYHIQLVLEELTVEVFNKCYKDITPDIAFNIEYSEYTDELIIKFTFRSAEFNPFVFEGDEIDNLGMSLVSKILKYSEFHYSNGLNNIIIKI
jgi:polar amino acid transport system ATP-binding protein